MFEGRAHFERGPNQGYLEPHDEVDTRARADSLEDVLDEIATDVLEWDVSIPVPERRAAIREAKIEAQEWIERNSTKEERIARLRALIAEIEAE